MDVTEHWERVYADRDPQSVSWYQPRPELSLALIESARLAPADPILDVGAGASSLVDELLAAGYTDVSVLDVSARALELDRRRLGPAADRVAWIQADVLAFVPDRTYRLWHDRALLHFLTAPADRRRYVELLASSLAPGGEAVLSTFGPEGPEWCSGLPVHRYSADSLAELLGDRFTLLDRIAATHSTPSGVTQQFVYTRFRHT